jgi:ribosomal small subunit protein bTHX
MGKGDKKSKKGKISKGSYGNSRKRKAIKAKLKRSMSRKPSTTEATQQKRTNKKKAEA